MRTRDSHMISLRSSAGWMDSMHGPSAGVLSAGGLLLLRLQPPLGSCARTGRWRAAGVLQDEDVDRGNNVSVALLDGHG